MYFSTSLNETDAYIGHSLDHILLLTVMFPLDLYLISELWLIFTKYLLERRFKKEKYFLRINSPNLLSNLAHIDYAIFDKTGTLTTNKKHVSLLYFRESGTIYEFADYGSFLGQLWKSSHFETNLQTMLFIENKQNIPFRDAKILNSKTLIEQFNTLEGLNLFNSLLENLVLTNSMRFQYSNKKQKREFKFGMKDEKLLFYFGKHLDYEFLNYFKKDGCLYYSLRVKKHVYDYKILGFHEQECGMVYNIFTIIYQDPRTKNYILSCKAHTSTLINKLNFSKQEFEILDSILLKFNKKGFIDPLMYTKKLLSKQEADSFLERYKNLQSSLINQEDYITDLINEYLIDLDLLGLAGIQETLEPEAFELIKFLKSLSINSWILTGDSKLNAFNVASRIGIFDGAADQYCIESENYEDLVKQIKRILGPLSNSLKKNDPQSPMSPKIKKNILIDSKKTTNLRTVFDEKYDKYILINGKSFDIIIHDQYLYSNFLFICSILRTVIGFNFSAENKNQFVEIIRSKFNQKSTVMAIGDGFNDILMMNSADVGIEIAKNQKNFAINMMLGDFVVSNLRQVKELMMTHSGVCFDRFQKLNEFSYFKSFIFGFSLFLYIFFDQYSSNCFYDVLITVFYFGFFNIPSHVLYLLFYRKFPDRMRKDLPEIYQEGKYQKKNKKISKSLFLLLLEGILISTAISLFTFFLNGDAIDPEGHTSNYNGLGLIHVYSYSIFLHLKVIKIKDCIIIIIFKGYDCYFFGY